MPDFGEGFNRSDAMLLTMPSTSICPEAPSSNVDSRNPYLDPLLDPSTSSGGVFDTSKNCYAAETQSSSPASTVPSRETAEAASGNVLSEMSMADAIKCITGFLSTDSRSATLCLGSSACCHCWLLCQLL